MKIEVEDDKMSAEQLQQVFGAIKQAESEHALAAAAASQSLNRLIEVMRNRSGQSETVRCWLRCLWTGGEHPVDVSSILTLDWQVRRDLIEVLAGFGHKTFFYDEMKAALQRAGEFEWVIAE
jgi:hypothetical protein